MTEQLRAWTFLVTYSLRRQLFSTKVIVAAGLLGISCLLVLLASMRRTISPQWFGEVVTLALYSPFVFPMLLLGFGTGALGDDRDEGTLGYLLTRPLPRSSIYLGKLVATLPIALTLAIGGLWLLCSIASRTGTPEMADVFGVLAWPHVLAAIAYLSFFHFLAVAFRHSTIIAIVYVLFIEVFLGTVPGVIKRVSIRFYSSSMTFDSGSRLGIAPPEDLVFQPISGAAATATLMLITAGFLAAGTWVFARREFRDVT